MMIFTRLFQFKKKIDERTESSISSLAPKVLTEEEELKKIQPYLDKLKETIDAKGVNNIALTGSYGSGKSTIGYYGSEEENLALHGGTAIDLFVRNMPRLSVDVER